MYQEKIRVVENEIAKKEEEILSVKHRIEDLQLAKEQAQRRLAASVNEASKESKLQVYTKENGRLKKAEDELVAEEKILELLSDDLKQLQIQKTEYERAEKEHELKKKKEKAIEIFREIEKLSIEIVKKYQEYEATGQQAKVDRLNPELVKFYQGLDFKGQQLISAILMKFLHYTKEISYVRQDL